MTKNFGKLLKRAFACFLVVVMTLSAVPMSGFVGLEMPKWSQLFATKASAEDELTPEDCVDIYMDNSYVWLKRDTDKYDYTYYYSFLDLDFDGVLEMLRTQEVQGTGFFTYNAYFKIDKSDESVYQIPVYLDGENRTYDGCGLDYRLTDPLELYKNKTTGEYFYFGSDLWRSGIWENGCENRILTYTYRINAKTIFSEYRYLENPSSDYKTKYYAANTPVSKTDYDKKYKAYFDNCENLELKYSYANKTGESLYAKSSATQRKLLLEAYKAFNYNGYKTDFNFNYKSNNVYLGTNANENNVKGVSLTFKGTADEVKKFTTSRIKKWEIADTSIAEYKSCKLSPIIVVGQTSVTIFAYLEAKKEGKTTLTATLDDGTTTKCEIIVKRPNEVTMEIKDVGTYYAIDNVFFDEYGNYSGGAVDINTNFYNLAKDEIESEITDKQALENLKVKKLKLELELNAEGFSLEPDSYANTKEIILEEEEEDIELYKKVEKVVQVFSSDDALIDSKGEVICGLKFKVSLPDENGEYVEEAEDEIGFTVKSYKREYVEDHIAAVSPGGDYSLILQSSFAVNMAEIGDDFDYNWYQWMSKGVVEGLVDFVSDFDEVTGYQLIISDYISMLNSQENVERNLINNMGDTALDCSKTIFDAVVDYTKSVFGIDFYRKLVKDMKGISLQQVMDVLDGDDTSSRLYKCMQDMLRTDKGRNMFNNALRKVGRVGDVFQALEIGVVSINSAIEAYNMYVSLESFRQIQEEQIDTLKQIRNSAEKSGNAALAKAIDSYLDYSNLDSELEKFGRSVLEGIRHQSGKLLDIGVTFSVKTALKLTKDNLTGFAKEYWFGAGGVVDVISGVLNGIMAGKFVSNLLCNNKEYAEYSFKLVGIGLIQKDLIRVVKELAADLKYYDNANQIDKAYECASRLDEALKMVKIFEQEAYSMSAAALEASGDSWIKTVCQKKDKQNLKTEATKFLCKSTNLATLHCHNLELAEIYAQILSTTYSGSAPSGSVGNQSDLTTYKTITIQCPVDVFVYHGKTLVTAIENNVVTKSDSRISTLVIDDQKFVMMPADNSYSVKLVATEDGTMDYSVFELDAAGQPLRNVSYDAVTLTKDKQFTAQINDESIADASSYDLASEGETISATSDDYVRLTGLCFEKSEESIYVDNTATLTVSKTPENASETIFRWESSDPSVAEVDAYGTVTGISAGTAEISCISKIDDTVKATVTVTVSDCTHSFTDYETVSESTCTSYGYQSRTCTVCGKAETKAIETLKAHEPDGEQYTIEATCTENAKKVRLCKNCCKIGETIEEPDTALGHDVVLDKAVAATCTRTGLTEGKRCARCQEVFTAQKTVAKKSHTLVKTVTKATTTADGKAVTSCKVCKASKTVVIPKVASITLSASSYAYDGKVKSPKVTVKDSKGKTLTKNTDYTLTASSGRTNMGRYAVKVTLKGNYSGSKTLYFDIVPAQVTKLKATQTTSSITLSWSKVAGSNMRYYVFSYNLSTKKYKSLGCTTGTSCTVKKLSSGTTYYYAVQAYNTTAKKWGKASATLTTATKPGTPTLKAVAGTKKATLSWNKQNGATGYVLYMSTSKNGSYSKIATLKGNTKVSYTKTGLTTGKYYYFKVIAYKTVGSTNIYGAYSSVRYVRAK